MPKDNKKPQFEAQKQQLQSLLDQLFAILPELNNGPLSAMEKIELLEDFSTSPILIRKMADANQNDSNIENINLLIEIDGFLQDIDQEFLDALKQEEHLDLVINPNTIH